MYKEILVISIRLCLMIKKNIKAAERSRRNTKISISVDIFFDPFMTVPANQQQILIIIETSFQ